jgi:hypothetical protein
MHKFDLFALLSAVVGFASLSADAAFSTQVSTLFGSNGTTVLAVLGMVGTLAAQVLRILGNPTTTTPPSPVTPVTIITPAASMTTEVKNDAA